MNNSSKQNLNEFFGSVNTLINASKLRVLTYKQHLQQNAGLTLYEKLQKDHTYMLVELDVARGTKNDNSAFVLFDITEVPYKVVATFKDNEIKPLLFPQKIHQVARAYNRKTFVLVEVNDNGEQVGEEFTV